MNLTSGTIAGCQARPGDPVLVRRTDGSNRTHHAICTERQRHGLEMKTAATLAVGEVIELVTGEDNGQPQKSRARILYRRMSFYGLAWLSGPSPEPADASSPPRLAAGKLLSKLKASYDALPARQRAAVRSALAERARLTAA